MKEKRVKLRKNELMGTWVDSMFNNGIGYAVVIDCDGDVHLVNFREITVLPDI